MARFIFLGGVLHLIAAIIFVRRDKQFVKYQAVVANYKIKYVITVLEF